MLSSCTPPIHKPGNGKMAVVVPNGSSGAICVLAKVWDDLDLQLVAAAAMSFCEIGHA